MAMEQDFSHEAPDKDLPRISSQPFCLPKGIHSAASLMNGVSSTSRLSASQADAVRDPMSSARDPMSSSRDHTQGRAETEIGRASVPHDEAHWQDEYATNWDRIGMRRNASSSDAAAAAMQQVSCPSGLHDESEARSSRGKAWACKLCTFAENPSHSIRCEVCETVRGSTWQDHRLTPSATSTALDASATGLRAAQPEPHASAVHTISMRNKRQSSKQQQRSIAGFLGSGVSKGIKVGESDHAAETVDSGHSHSHVVEPAQQPPNESGWLRVDFHTEVRWQCAKCQCWFQTGQKAEHDDYHLALELHQHCDNVPHILHNIKRQKICNMSK